MVQKRRGPAPVRRLTRLVSMVMLGLASAGICRASGGGGDLPASAADAAESSAPQANAQPVAPDGAGPVARVARSPTHRVAGQGIDQTVRRMSRGLDLDAKQQAELRQILLDQHRQMQKLRTEGSAARVDWAAATVAISDQTKARIRALLSDRQREKYTSDVPREQTAPAQADLGHWMQIQESNRRRDDGEPK
jgi:hypothetical protein